MPTLAELVFLSVLYGPSSSFFAPVYFDHATRLPTPEPVPIQTLRGPSGRVRGFILNGTPSR
jgi:hypothetical protein